MILIVNMLCLCRLTHKQPGQKTWKQNDASERAVPPCWLCLITHLVILELLSKWHLQASLDQTFLYFPLKKIFYLRGSKA